MMPSISFSVSRSSAAAGVCWGLLLLIFIRSAQATITFPDIKIPSGKEPHDLGVKWNWGLLETAIQPLERFRVTSAAAEAHLAKTIRRIFDESKNSDGWGIIHGIVGYSGGDNDALLEKLLALGLHPDLENKDKWRPSHLCSQFARPKSAKVISLCRPNLSAKYRNHDTPLGVARSLWPVVDRKFLGAAENRPALALLWEEVEKNGFPSIAQMASNKQWFAVQNLLRRGVVCRFTEGSVSHQGKTAIEWAVHHGESSLAEELRYYLESYPSDFTVALDEDEAKQTASCFTTMDTKLEKLAKDLPKELKLAQDTSLSKTEKTLRDEMKEIRRELKLAQDNSSAKREKTLRDEMKDIRRELTLAQDSSLKGEKTLRDEMKDIQRELKLAQDTSSSKTEKTLRDEMKEIQKAAEKYHDEVCHNITETIISRVRSTADEAVSNLRQLMEKIAERQKGLDQDVQKLEAALEKAIPPADDNETQMLEQPFDTSNITAVESSMTEPTDKGPTELVI